MKKAIYSIALLVAGTLILSIVGCDDKTEPITPDKPCEVEWFADNDGDGLGNPNDTKMACEQPEGYVSNADDALDKAIERKQVPIIFKITGENCYYCGDWGWQAWIDMSNKFKDGKALSWGNYGTGFSNGFFRGQELNSTMDPIENMFEDGGSKPNFATNGVDYGTSAAQAEAAANSSLSATAKVAAVLDARIEGDQLTITAEAEFFEDMTGEYWMGAYLIEDKAVGPQSGPAGANGDPEHHLVMRGSLDALAWGRKIVDNGATAGTKVMETYTATIPASFNKDNFSYGLIVWKKLGTNFLYQNAYSTQ